MPRALLKPYWRRGPVVLYHGDVSQVLARLPSESVHTVVTSPPYWGLRDYGVEGQIGSEKTPEEFVEKMVEVFREIRRILRDDGTVWLNLGDSYSSSGIANDQNALEEYAQRVRGQKDNGGPKAKSRILGRAPSGGLRSGNLVGMPWRVALALQADGWILRQDIIWHKPSPMPESVRNRCTKAHEYIFLLTKRGSGYYYDQKAIKEGGGGYRTGGAMNYQGVNGREKLEQNVDSEYYSRNRRSVWTVASQSYEGAHFATFPEKLIEPCILAGCPERCCTECGMPYLRIVEETKLTRSRPNDYVKRTREPGTGNATPNSVAGVATRTKGWEQQCKCKAGYVGGVVLDPFVGSGTACCVALKNGRRSIGVDLSEEYLVNNAIVRIEGVMLSIPRYASLVRKKTARLKGRSLVG